MAYHSLFVRNMFVPDWTVLNVPSLRADPERDQTCSDTFIPVDFSRRVGPVGGAEYAGENRKVNFGLLKFLVPASGVTPMHCSANMGADLDGSGGDVALLFGLPGTDKTTLSADPHRALIGDDEHGWTDTVAFNFEGAATPR